MSKQNLYLGKNGEDAALELLKESGYRILSRNYRTRLGEIDIIGYDRDTLCFVEVKTRNSTRFGLPQEAVSRSKQRQISKAALVFIKEKKLFNRKARFDVVSVMNSAQPPKIKLIKNAFELDQKFTP